MSSFPLVVSYYTKNTPYQLEVQNLIDSCEKWGLAHHIEGIESQGSWELNCAYKPFFLLKSLLELNRPILWVDADGIFIRAPDSSVFKGIDFSVRINEECDWDHPSRVVSSTVYVNNTEGGSRILSLWAQESIKLLSEKDRKVEFWDQVALRNVLKVKNFLAVVRGIPLSYAKIFDHPHDLLNVEKPVIEHYQASRRYKGFVNKTS